MLERFRAHPTLAAFAAAYYGTLVAVGAATGADQTGWDLVANFVGASGAALWVRAAAAR